LFRGLPGEGKVVESAGRAGAAGFPAPCGMRFGAGDLWQVRRVTARWAVRAAVTGPAPCAAALSPGGPGGRLRGAGRMDGRRIGA
jgi:hypothetical protein